MSRNSEIDKARYLSLKEKELLKEISTQIELDYIGDGTAIDVANLPEKCFITLKQYGIEALYYGDDKIRAKIQVEVTKLVKSIIEEAEN